MNKAQIDLKNFREYAAFLHKNHLEAIVTEDLKRNREVDLPLLKLFTHLSEMELLALSKKSMEEYLLRIIEDKAIDAILQSIEDWKADKLPGIAKGQIVASDISLIYNVRKHTLFTFLPYYTKDLNLAVTIIKEIENFYTFQETLAIQTFSEIKQEELKKSETRLKESQALAHLGHWEYNVSENKVIWSEELYKIYDLTFSEGITPAHINERIHKEDMQGLVEKVRKCIANGESFNHEYRIVLPNGETRIIYEQGYKEKTSPDKTILKGISLDITERKKAEQELNTKNYNLQETNEELARTEEALKELNIELEERVAKRTRELRDSLQRFQLLSETVPQIFWTARPDGGMDYFNKKWYDYTGFSVIESMEMGFIKALHPDDVSHCENTWKECIRTGAPYDIELRFKRKSDGAYRWHLGRAMPLRDEYGTIIKWFGTATDIHDQKEAMQNLEKAQKGLHTINYELSLKNEELIKTNNDLDNFIYTASHDLKAPISNIEGLIHALKSHDVFYKDQEIKSLLDMMTFSVERFKNTILDLTEITKAQKSSADEIGEINAQEIIDEVKFSIKDLIQTSHATFETELKIASIKFSRKNLRSILFNLISNAIKYKAPNRDPKILIETEKTDGHILLSVKDNGLGIDMSHKSKIFSMFKRLHDHVEGTGVGLYIVKRIIDNAGGKIEVESEIDKGATFKIYFKN